MKLIALLLFISAATFSYTQRSSEALVQIIDKARNRVRAEENKGHRLVLFRSDMISDANATLERHKAVMFWSDPNKTYHFWAIAENQVGQIKLTTYDRTSRDEEYRRLVRDEAGTSVSYQASKMEELTITVVEKARNNTEPGHYAVVVTVEDQKVSNSGDSNGDRRNPPRDEEDEELTRVESYEKRTTRSNQNCDFSAVNDDEYKSTLRYREEENGERSRYENIKARFTFELDSNEIIQKIGRDKYKYNIVDQECDGNDLYLTAVDKRGAEVLFLINVKEKEISIQNKGRTYWMVYRI